MNDKYKLSDLEKMDVLPEDCNADAEKYAATFKDGGLMVMMKRFREKKITHGYGEATHLGASGTPEAIFSFHKGICKHASPLIWIDNKNVAKGSMKFY